MKKRAGKKIMKKSLRHRLKGFLSFTQFMGILRRKKIREGFSVKLPRKISHNKKFIPLNELKEEMEHQLKSKKKRSARKKVVKRKAVRKRVSMKKTVKKKAVKKKVDRKKIIKRKQVKKKVAKKRKVVKKAVKHKTKKVNKRKLIKKKNKKKVSRKR